MSQTTCSAAPDVARFAAAYLEGFQRLVGRTDLDALGRMVNRLETARADGRTIFIAGNGGSASTASHWVNDLGKATKTPGAPPVRVMSLCDNVSWLTALGNDEGFERVFAGQLENFAQPGDVLIVISASGNSPNLVRAVQLARERRLTTLALLGFDGGVLKALVDDCVWFATDKDAYGPVESAHSLLCHLVTACLQETGASSDGSAGA